jgi:hypothetical protein
MKENESNSRVTELVAEIHSSGIQTEARRAGDTRRWSRERKMPWYAILMCTLAKKGLCATMELRQFFQAAGRAEQTVSKQD